MLDKPSSGFFILFLRRYDNQTLKIVIQDMEMTAKELRWKVMKVKLEFEVVQNVRPSDYTPDCVSGIQLYCFQLFKILRLTDHISPRYTSKN